MAKRIVFHLNKLIRTKLLDVIVGLGQEPEVKVLEGKDKIRAIIVKIIEEAQELDPDSPSYSEELADVLQAVTDLVDESEEDVEAIRLSKLAEKGGFRQGIFISKLALKPNDKWVDYYRKEPQKYPEEKSNS